MLNFYQKKSKPKATKWDEMNIIATLHPPDKDYGHMKIEEPKTPYNWDMGDEDDVVDHPQHVLDPEELAAKLQGNLDRSSRTESLDKDSDDSESDLTPEELARRKVFKSKRKMHYNEFKVVEFARKLIKADEEALDNDENESRNPSSSKTRSEDYEEDDSQSINESKVEEIRLQDSEDSAGKESRKVTSMEQN